MNKYRICWWECNGYDDSDWYGVYFDEADGQLHRIELGTTRAACAIGFSEEYLLPTPEIVERARKALVPRIYEGLRGAEHRDIFTPGPHNVEQGREFRLLEAHSFYLKANGGFAKDEKGKRVKVTLPAGTVVSSCKNGADFFGTRFAKGYNQPNRGNTTVYTMVKVEKGWQHVRVPMDKLRQHAEPMTDEWLMNRAEELSLNLQFHPCFGCRAWCSDNWAEKVGLPLTRLAS